MARNVEKGNVGAGYVWGGRRRRLMARMGLWLAGRRALAKGTSWTTGWVAGATREVIGG